ncbi:hypothetical protein JXC34_03755 [Candidatus Woesearchaeota archaeon]|nr:hypothetical protein [Candidatus Woesearchaeota archaeon]
MKDRYRAVKAVLFILIFLALFRYAIGQPTGAYISYNHSENKTPDPADYLNTSGGTFTTMIISGVTQNLRWKAYAGNVTGVLTLDDSGDYSIYQWELADFEGMVYASRNDSIAWDNIECASPYNITVEETEMNHTTTKSDSINNTFAYRTHKEFYVGSKIIENSTCQSTFTWVNDTAQTPSENATFQEILLHDGTNLVYATTIDNDELGFNTNEYDFQMILAEKGVAGYPNTRYYFYIEVQ